MQLSNTKFIICMCEYVKADSYMYLLLSSFITKSENSKGCTRTVTYIKIM